METLIEEYLYQHSKCPLPQVGSLRVKDGNAVAWHGDNKLSAPSVQIELSKEEIPSDHFIAFIASQKKVSRGEASLLLQKYCSDLQKLNTYTEMRLEHAGKFFVDNYGKLVFKQEALPKEFIPTVPMQLIARSKHATHNIRVGDRETTNEVMTDYYSEKGKVRKERWWIAALILTAATAGIMYFYFKDHAFGENFGNAQKVEPKPVQATYAN